MSAAGEALPTLWGTYRVSGDPHSREQLIEHYLPLARRTAARYFRFRADDSVPFEDYLQYARVGLVEAIDGFDPEREASFETYSSYRIRGAVLNGLGHATEITAQRSFWRTRRQERMESLKQDASSAGAEDLETFARLTVGLALGFLLEPGAEEAADDAVHANPYAATELEQFRKLVRGAVERLPPRERQIIRRHYF
jgi:RNA polymerase sigma factor FliA